MDGRKKLSWIMSGKKSKRKPVRARCIYIGKVTQNQHQSSHVILQTSAQYRYTYTVT
jgi:hypothetical protein